MKAFATSMAALALVLAPLAMAPLDHAHAQGWRDREGRGGGRAEGRGPAPRGEGRRDDGRRDDGRRGGGYRGPVYGGPAPGGYYPAPVPYPAGPPVYTAPPYGYGQPPPGYAPNSLGADWGQQQDQARRGVRQGGLLPLGQVIVNIRRSTPGRLLDAGLEPGPDGRPAYRVRWASASGRRVDFIIDAASGAIIGRNGY